MNLLSSVKIIDNSKLFFSSVELSKILACYSLGVSRGSWKDYSIYFGVKEAIFCMYKHSYASPDCILTKTIKNEPFIYFPLPVDLERENLIATPFYTNVLEVGIFRLE